MSREQRKATILEALGRSATTTSDPAAVAAIKLLHAVEAMGKDAGARVISSYAPELRLVFVNMQFVKSLAAIKPDVTMSYDVKTSEWDVWRACKAHLGMKLEFDKKNESWHVNDVLSDEEATLSYVATMIAAAIES